MKYNIVININECIAVLNMNHNVSLQLFIHIIKTSGQNSGTFGATLRGALRGFGNFLKPTFFLRVWPITSSTKTCYLLEGVQDNNLLLAGRVPDNNLLLAGRVPDNNSILVFPLNGPNKGGQFKNDLLYCAF